MVEVIFRFVVDVESGVELAKRFVHVRVLEEGDESEVKVVVVSSQSFVVEYTGITVQKDVLITVTIVFSSSSSFQSSVPVDSPTDVCVLSSTADVVPTVTVTVDFVKNTTDVVLITLPPTPASSIPSPLVLVTVVIEVDVDVGRSNTAESCPMKEGNT